MSIAFTDYVIGLQENGPTKFRAFKSNDGLWAVYELDAVQAYDDPYEFTYNLYSEVKFKSEKIAQDIAAHLNHVEV